MDRLKPSTISKDESKLVKELFREQVNNCIKWYDETPNWDLMHELYRRARNKARDKFGKISNDNRLRNTQRWIFSCINTYDSGPYFTSESIGTKFNYDKDGVRTEILEKKFVEFSSNYKLAEIRLKDKINKETGHVFIYRPVT